VRGGLGRGRVERVASSRRPPGPDGKVKFVRWSSGIRAAIDLAWIRRVHAGHKNLLTCLKLGPAYILHMLGELSVEYQLRAQRFRLQDSSHWRLTMTTASVTFA
jgi:hypothetical protein